MPTRAELAETYALPHRDAPRVRMNFVSSADGAVTLEGRSGPLGGETDRAVMRVLRAMADVVMVGAGTVRVEEYGGIGGEDEDAAWRRAHGLSPVPRPAVVSRSLRLDPRHPFFVRAEARPLVITCAAAPAEQRDALAEVADVLECGDESVDLGDALGALAHRGLTQVLCEGGPHLFGSLLDAGLVDEVCVTIAPRFVGGTAGRIAQGAPEGDRPFGLAASFADEDGFVFLRYAR
jgi:riboflavin-specific deaminase-like protein